MIQQIISNINNNILFYSEPAPLDILYVNINLRVVIQK